MTQLFRDIRLAGNCMNDYLPHAWLIDGIVVNKDLSTSRGISVEFPPYYTMTEAEQNDIHTRLQSYLNSLGANFSMQVVWEVFRSTKDINAKLESERGKLAAIPNPEAKDKISMRLLEETKERIDTFAANRHLRRYRGYFILTMAPNISDKTLISRSADETRLRKARNELYPEHTPESFFKSLFKSKKPPAFSKRYAPTEWEEITDAWKPALETLLTALNDMGFYASSMGDQDIVNFLYRFWNPKSFESLNPPVVEESALRMLPEYYLHGGLSMDRKKGTFYSDGCAHKILSLQTPPSTLSTNCLFRLLDEQYIPNLRIVCNIQPYDRGRRISELQKELPIIESRIHKDRKLAVVAEQISAEIYNLQQGQESSWKMAVYFHTWADDEQEVSHYANEVKRLGKMSGNAHITSEDVAIWNYWVAMQPFWGRDTDFYRHMHYSTTQLCCLLPISGHIERLKGGQTHLLLETANASIFNYDLMDNSRLNNYNALISGGSGTGKSFIAGSILMNMQRRNPRIICVDIGGSYKALSEAVGGEYITMDASSTSQTLNPLARQPGDPAKARYNVIKWLETASQDGGMLFSKPESADINNALTQLYEKFSESLMEPTLSDLRTLLSNFEDEKMRDIAHRLDLFCRGGTYGALFDGQTKINLENPFVVFDMTKIKSNPDLGPLTLMSIMNNVERMAASHPQTPKVLLLDEAWALLNNPSGASFVAEAFRTYRKLNVGIIGISQEVADWARGHLSGILSNVSTYIVLTQANSGTLEEAAEIVGFTEEEVSIAGQLKKVKGDYAQALLIQKCQNGRFSTVIVNRTTPLQYALMTTDGRDKSAILKIMEEERLDMLSARMRFAELYPKGV